MNQAASLWRAEISARRRHRRRRPGAPASAEIRKNTGHPVDSATYPEVGAMNILPSEARDDKSAYCVALNL